MNCILNVFFFLEVMIFDYVFIILCKCYMLYIDKIIILDNDIL